MRRFGAAFALALALRFALFAIVRLFQIALRRDCCASVLASAEESFMAASRDEVEDVGINGEGLGNVDAVLDVEPFGLIPDRPTGTRGAVDVGT